MYQNFWPYAIFIIVSLLGVNYLADYCMSRDFGALMVFLSYLVISYIVATSMRHTILHTQDERDKSVRLSFDCLVGLYLLVTGYSRYGGKLLNLPMKVVDTGLKTTRKMI